MFLKVRSIPFQGITSVVNWYDLEPVTARISEVTQDGEKTSAESDLEQVDYLCEFADPKNDYQEVDFWMEPKEAYQLQVAIWLPPGLYALKAFFIGPVTKHREEEYWSHTCLLRIDQD